MALDRTQVLAITDGIVTPHGVLGAFTNGKSDPYADLPEPRSLCRLLQLRGKAGPQVPDVDNRGVPCVAEAAGRPFVGKRGQLTWHFSLLAFGITFDHPIVPDTGVHP